LSLKITNFSI
jgi:3-oxoacyl-(acyl-carrier-protein) synthase